eukprot:TRINITY_DN966_c0_g1_i1.p1 TRINITY_DN966_c0_g1~~TRINITY_DN966_c0_g1_i1.p1  ORF type:complete len:149 (+),score=20.37 TRINITY_DN966_c0_g1_i1:70-516(+)
MTSTTMSSTCDVPDELANTFKKEFKLSKKFNRAMIMKIDKEKLIVEIEKVIEDVTLDDVQDELPESAPRFIAYCLEFTASDGRKSYPLVFIFYCPKDIHPALSTLYASTKNRLVNALQILKIYDCRDLEELTQEWLLSKLSNLKSNNY